MILTILLCHLGVCDRIVMQVPTCIDAEMRAQAIVAQTGLLHEGDEMIVRCDKMFKEG